MQLITCKGVVTWYCLTGGEPEKIKQTTARATEAKAQEICGLPYADSSQSYTDSGNIFRV